MVSRHPLKCHALTLLDPLHLYQLLGLSHQCETVGLIHRYEMDPWLLYEMVPLHLYDMVLLVLYKMDLWLLCETVLLHMQNSHKRLQRNEIYYYEFLVKTTSVG